MWNLSGIAINNFQSLFSCSPVSPSCSPTPAVRLLGRTFFVFGEPCLSTASWSVPLLRGRPICYGRTGRPWLCLVWTFLRMQGLLNEYHESGLPSCIRRNFRGLMTAGLDGTFLLKGWGRDAQANFSSSGLGHNLKLNLSWLPFRHHVLFSSIFCFV